MMPVSNAEYYTYQYYTWEIRGRGWFVANHPVQLEPPFIPFFRQVHKAAFIDDGKRHTIISSLLEIFKGKKQHPQVDTEVLDYEELEPYIDEEESTLKAIQVKLPKERKITVEKMKALIIMLSQSYKAISFEIIGNAKEIIIQFVADGIDIQTIETYIKGYFSECTVVYIDEYIDSIIKTGMQTTVIDFGLKDEFVRPLQTQKNFSIDPLFLKQIKMFPLTGICKHL